jgi:hypothetical protein
MVSMQIKGAIKGLSGFNFIMITVQIANEPFVNHSVGTINRGRQCSILSSGFLSTAMKKRKKINKKRDRGRHEPESRNQRYRRVVPAETILSDRYTDDKQDQD